MSVPLTATHRINIPYVVDTLPHSARVYVSAVATTLADPTGYDFQFRSPGVPHGASECIDALLGKIGPCLQSSNSSFGTVTIQEYASGAWNPIATWTSAVAPSGGGSQIDGVQYTLSMRDTLFHKMRFILLEGIWTVPAKDVSLATFSVALNNLANAFVVTSDVSDELPWHWAKSRGNLYVGSFVSQVTDTNDKVRRSRGLA